MRELLRFLRQNDLRTILAALHNRDVHPVIQFFKYCICGVVALTVQTIVFFSLARWAFPALESNAPDQAARADNALINTLIAFVFSNATVYVLNVNWVFTPGRHTRVREFLLFTLVNAPGAICGTAVQDWLIRIHGWPTWAAFAGYVLPNVFVNFFCRKLFIFRK